MQTDNKIILIKKQIFIFIRNNKNSQIDFNHDNSFC